MNNKFYFTSFCSLENASFKFHCNKISSSLFHAKCSGCSCDEKTHCEHLFEVNIQSRKSKVLNQNSLDLMHFQANALGLVVYVGVITATSLLLFRTFYSLKIAYLPNWFRFYKMLKLI